MPARLLLALLLALFPGVACTPDVPRDDDAGGEDDDDSVSDDDDLAIDCPAVLSIEPQMSETEVFGDEVRVTWDAVPVDGEVTVAVVGGDPVPGSITTDDNDRALVFVGDALFQSNSTIEVTIQQSCADDLSYTFETAPYGAPMTDPDGALDRVYRVDLAGATLVAPEGITALVQGFVVDEYLLISPTSASQVGAGEMHVRAAPGMLDGDGEIVQDLALATWQLTQGADGVAGTADDSPGDWDDPWLTITAAEMALWVQGIDSTLRDLTMTALFAPDAESYVGGVLDAEIDTRPLAGGGNPSAICTMLAQSAGSGCVPCADGQVFCARVRYEDVTGAWLPGIAGLVPVP